LAASRRSGRRRAVSAAFWTRITAASSARSGDLGQKDLVAGEAKGVADAVAARNQALASALSLAHTISARGQQGGWP